MGKNEKQQHFKKQCRKALRSLLVWLGDDRPPGKIQWSSYLSRSLGTENSMLVERRSWRQHSKPCFRSSDVKLTRRHSSGNWRRELETWMDWSRWQCRCQQCRRVASERDSRMLPWHSGKQSWERARACLLHTALLGWNALKSSTWRSYIMVFQALCILLSLH